MGQVPYGFTLGEDGDRLLPDAEEQEILQEIRRRRAAGETLQTIANDLTDRRRESFEAFLEQVEDLGKQWRAIAGAFDDAEGATPQPRRTVAALLPRRLVDLFRARSIGPSRSRRPPPSEREEPLSARDYALPILQVLDEAGGTASIDEVRDGVKRILSPRFTPADRVTMKSGKPRWQVRIDAASQRMKNQRLLASTKRRKGIWEITGRGREILYSGDIDEVWSMRSWRSD